MSFKDASRKNTSKRYFSSSLFYLSFLRRKINYPTFLKFCKYSSELLGFENIECHKNHLPLIMLAFSEREKTLSKLSISNNTKAKIVHFRRRTHVPNVVPKPHPFFSRGRDLDTTLLVISEENFQTPRA